MWSLKRAKVLGIVTIMGLSGCGSSSTGPNPASLVGIWQATQAQLVAVSNASITIDLVKDLGGTVELVLAADKTFTLTITLPPEPADQSAGTWASTDILTLTYTSGQSGNQQFDLNLNGDTLTLTGANTDYDFPNDAISGPVPAKVNLILQRQ
jgi:hypothetical protein